MKRCSTCKGEFERSGFYKNSKMRDGVSNVCKPCQHQYAQKHYSKNRPKYLSKMQGYKASNLRNGMCASGCGAPLHWSNKNYCLEHAALRGRYYGHNLELDGRLILFARQNGECAICHREDKDPMSFFVDHDHVTGFVRGLLCRTCNSGIGLFQDQLSRIESAYNYLSERMI